MSRCILTYDWLTQPRSCSSKQRQCLLIQADEQASDALLVLRNQVNLVLEQACNKKLLGSVLQAKVLLHVADASAVDSLRKLNAAADGADSLRYAFITSQAELVDTQKNGHDTASCAVWGCAGEQHVLIWLELQSGTKYCHLHGN